MESNAVEKASRTGRSCTNYRQHASNTAGGTGSIIDTDPEKICDTSEVELTTGLQRTFDALTHGLQPELGITFQRFADVA